MTKKDFEAIAAVFKSRVQWADAQGRFSQFEVALKLVDYFETANSRFDRTRFLLAAGFERELTLYGDTKDRRGR